jgi:hypothetical protein
MSVALVKVKVKVKVKLSLPTPLRQGEQRSTPLILNLASRWRLVLNIMPRPIYPSTHERECGVDPRAGLDVSENKVLCPSRDSNPHSPVYSLVSMVVTIQAAVFRNVPPCPLIGKQLATFRRKAVPPSSE